MNLEILKNNINVYSYLNKSFKKDKEFIIILLKESSEEEFLNIFKYIPDSLKEIYGFSSIDFKLNFSKDYNSLNNSSIDTSSPYDIIINSLKEKEEEIKKLKSTNKDLKIKINTINDYLDIIVLEEPQEEYIYIYLINNIYMYIKIDQKTLKIIKKYIHYNFNKDIKINDLKENLNTFFNKIFNQLKINNNVFQNKNIEYEFIQQCSEKEFIDFTHFDYENFDIKVLNFNIDNSNEELEFSIIYKKTDEKELNNIFNYLTYKNNKEIETINKKLTFLEQEIFEMGRLYGQKEIKSKFNTKLNDLTRTINLIKDNN